MASYRAGRFIDPRGLLTMVLVLIGVGMAFDLGSIVSSLMQYELLGRMASEGPWTEEEAAANDTRELAVTGVTLVWQLVMAIPFLKLLGRFNHNAWSFGAKGMKFTPGWTVGWFFVPLANLIQPVLAVQELWRVSQQGEGAWAARAASPIVGTWWGLWIARNVLGQLSRAISKGEGLEPIQTATLVDIANLLVSLILSGVAILMLKQIVTLQLEREESGERYDRATETCHGCGEPITLRMGNCPVCGRNLDIETLEPA